MVDRPGQIEQVRSIPYEGIFTLNGETEQGALIGTSESPALRCGGDIALVAVEETRIEGIEHITSGIRRSSGWRKQFELV